MKLPVEDLQGRLRNLWKVLHRPDGSLTLFCTTANVISIKEDIKEIYGYVFDYLSGKGIDLECTLSTKSTPFGKFEIPADQMIFWEQRGDDDILMIPLDGLFNEATMTLTPKWREK